MDTAAPGVEARELAAELGANGVDRVMAERFKHRLREADPGNREPILAGALSHYMASVGKALAKRDDRAARRAAVLALLYDAAYDEVAAEDTLDVTA